MGVKVHLRQRKQTKHGRISLYLEIYKGVVKDPDGRIKPVREYKYLDLYLIDNPKSPIDKESNKEALILAEKVKTKLQSQIDSGKHGFNSAKPKMNFIEYFESLAMERKRSKGNFGNWDSALKHLIRYAGEIVPMKMVDEEWCKGFKDYLQNVAKTKGDKPLSSASVAAYYTKLRATLKQAAKSKLIPYNYAQDIGTPKVRQTKRHHLTLEELKALKRTECRYDVLKRAFIFSCLTGLRWSDVQKLVWGEVVKGDDGWRVDFHQKKTSGLEYQPVPDQALEYIGERGQSHERVFVNLNYSSYTNVALQQWMMRANITKPITFHCARHTFAVMQLSIGTDIYTLSKLLGHKEIRTTEIYAAIVSSTKREAVNRIPNLNI